MASLHHDAGSDAELVEAARGGDRDAFGALYDRYADRIHDFCASVLRDRHEAADATQDAFLIAARRLDQLRDPTKVKSWLYSIARHEAIRRAKARARARPEEDVGSALPDERDAPGDAVTREEATTIVWDAAAGLNERDRALLDLHVRQGLVGQDLADAMGVRPNTASMAVNRLKKHVERALGALLVARLGHDDCTDLQGILAGWDGTFSPLIRKRVARHVDGCDTCADNRSRFTSPLALLASVPALPAPESLRAHVLGGVDLAPSAASTAHTIRLDRRGFPKSSATATWKQVVAAVVVGSVAGVGAVAGVVALRSDPDPAAPTPVASPTTEPTGTTGADDAASSTVYAGAFTSFPGALPGELVENRIHLEISLESGQVSGTSTWSFSGPEGGRFVHDYTWAGTLAPDTGAMNGRIDADLTGFDGSPLSSGTGTWSARLDVATGLVTGTVELDDTVLEFTVETGR